MAGRVAILLSSASLLHMPLGAGYHLASANGLTDGVSSSGYVCDPNGCSPTDKRDYWKIKKNGDIVQVTFSGSMSNAAWWCPVTGGRTLTMGSVSQNVDDGSPTATSQQLQRQVRSSSRWKAKILTGNDGFDYTLTPSIDKTNRDSMKTGSSTPRTTAPTWSGPPPTTEKAARFRRRCWSDPDSGCVQNGADAFASESLMVDSITTATVTTPLTG